MRAFRLSAALLAVTLSIVFFSLLSFADELSQPQYSVIEELDVRVGMRDGVCLSTNVYRPDDTGKFPALLMRTPYGNGGAGNGGGRYWAERGYVAVFQDTRGRYESEGEFYPIFNEAADGLDAQKWVSEQPWCNGKIGTFGGSYVGMTQWMPALEGSEYVTAMFTSVPYTEVYTVHFQNGANRLRMFSNWYAMMTAPYDFDREAYLSGKIDDVDRHLPVAEEDTVLGWRMPYVRDALHHPERDSYWEPIRFQGRYENVKAAAYILAGWFDLFTGQNLNSFMEMTKNTRTLSVRKNQKIIIGPWAHGGRGSKLGDIEFGEASIVNSTEIMHRWFDWHLKGIDSGIMDEPPVNIFVMGDNEWRFENEWPLARTEYTDYYLHSSGAANTKDGNGSLSTAKPGSETPDRYSYDPADPVPSDPNGNVYDDFRNLPIDHSPVEARQDVLVYTTAPLARDTEVTGPVSLTLYAESSAKNTDFTGKLLDVYPDGRAIYLCDGIIRASFRDGPVNTTFIEPGTVYEYTIDLWATSNVFKKGHRIRLEVSSSNFPRFDRNLNTSLNNGLATGMATAEQTVHHDAKYPSRLVLPVIPR